MVSTWKESKLQRAVVGQLATLKTDQTTNCRGYENPPCRLWPQGRVGAGCLSRSNPIRIVPADSGMMAAKNADSKERLPGISFVDNVARPTLQKSTTHVEAFVALTADAGSNPATSKFQIRRFCQGTLEAKLPSAETRSQMRVSRSADANIGDAQNKRAILNSSQCGPGWIVAGMPLTFLFSRRTRCKSQ